MHPVTSTLKNKLFPLYIYDMLVLCRYALWVRGQINFGVSGLKRAFWVKARRESEVKNCSYLSDRSMTEKKTVNAHKRATMNYF